MILVFNQIDRYPDADRDQIYSKIKDERVRNLVRPEDVVMTAAKLADFQSPKFKAIAVIAPPPNPDALNKARLDGKVIDLNDAQALGKLYATIVKKAG